MWPSPRTSAARSGWATMTGDGEATIDLKAGRGHASLVVDATADHRGIWWALIKRRVSGPLDLALRERPGYELHIDGSSVERPYPLEFQTQELWHTVFRGIADDATLRPMGRATSGVTGMKFRDRDELLKKLETVA